MSVCSSSMNVMICPSESLISFSTAFSRSSNSPRYFAPATSAARSRLTSCLSLSEVGNIARDDALGKPLDDRGLADARFADEYGVVLGAPREHLAHAPDLGVATDHGVELARARDVREIDAVPLERGLLFVVGCGSSLHVCPSGTFLRCGHGELGGCGGSARVGPTIRSRVGL